MEIDVIVHLFFLSQLDDINILLPNQISKKLYHAAAADDDDDVHHMNDASCLSVQA